MSDFVALQLLDWMYGRPVGRVRAWLHYKGDSEPIDVEVTDEAGRCHLTLPSGQPHRTYQLVLDVDPYFVALGIRPSCPELIVTFQSDVTGSILLILAPTGYTAYIGQRPGDGQS
jgi:5-hydroxyisourate hydrolase-like protein (transthyretin family)